MTIQIISLFIAAYLIGAIPFSVWIGKVFFGKDIRKEGSGNAGATNTFRVLGTVAGAIVLILDILKGATAVLLSKFLNNVDHSNLIFYQTGLGLTAAIGHIYPVYLRFKGGKGVATLFGVVLIIFPIGALSAVAAFTIIFLTTRYVSLGSMIASVVFMFSIFLFDERRNDLPVIVFAIAAPVIVFYTHRKNIQRLLNGTENKISFSKKSTSQ